MLALLRRIWSRICSIFRLKRKNHTDIPPRPENAQEDAHTFVRAKIPEPEPPEDPGIVFGRPERKHVDARIQHLMRKAERYEKTVDDRCRKAHKAKHLYMNHPSYRVRKKNWRRLVKEFCRLSAAVHERDLAYARLQALRDEEKREDKPSGQM